MTLASRVGLTGALFAATALTGASELPAQVQASEKYTLTQIMDSVTITLTGARPSVRGRVIYGDVVPWNHSWVAGARVPTILDIGRDFQIGEAKVPAGQYSLWVVPREHDQWSLILDPRTELNHGADPDSTAEQYHALGTVRTIDPVETLTWSFNDMRGYRANLSMAWGDKAVDFALKFASSVVLTTEPELATAIVGEYAVSSPDTTRPAMADAALVSHQDGMLIVRFVGGQLEEWTRDTPFTLVHLTDDMFVQAEVFEGELVQLLNYLVWEFARTGDRASSFELRSGPQDRLWFSGTLKP